jgi:hypothetical protein
MYSRCRCTSPSGSSLLTEGSLSPPNGLNKACGLFITDLGLSPVETEAELYSCRFDIGVDRAVHLLRISGHSEQ